MIPLYLITLGILFGGILIILIALRKKIDRKLHPERWVKIEMLEKDNNCLQWYEKKRNDLQFTFNDGTYNMFEVVTKIDSQGNNYMQKYFTSIYREKTIAKLFYVEGNQNPLDFRNNKITSDAQQSKQMDKIQISRLLNLGGGASEEFLQKYGVFILIGILMIVLYIAFKK